MLEKIHLSKFEDVIGFVKQVTNQAASHLATQRTLLGVIQNGRFLKEEPWGSGATDRRKGRIILGLRRLCFGGGGEEFSSCRLPSFCGEWRGLV